MRFAQAQTLAATANLNQNYYVFLFLSGEEDVSAFETLTILLQNVCS
jgi:hypothetical protein